MKIRILFLILLVIILTGLSKELLDSDELVISSLAEQVTSEQLGKILDFNEKWEWISYFFVSLVTLLKIFVISLIIDLGCFFFDVKIRYKKIVEIVTKGEFVFLFATISKILWFYLFKQNYTLQDLQYFYPLSALNIVGYKDLQTWFVYPFQILNLFELVYWFTLAYLIGKETKTNTDKGFSIVASSYGISLLIWTICIMFFTLNAT